MAIHTELSPAEGADRLAIRELFDAYAHCADTRDAEGQRALFTADTRFAERNLILDWSETRPLGTADTTP